MEAGLISIEDGLISMEAGLISTESSGEHDVYFEVKLLQFLLEVPNITSKATNYSVCNKCARFCKLKPHYIAYIFAWLLIKLCQFSIWLTFLRNGLTLREAGLISIDAGLISMEAGLISIEDGLISVEAGLISIETSGEHDVVFQV